MNKDIIMNVKFHAMVCPNFYLSKSLQMSPLFFRVRKLKNTPIYVKPQLTSDGGTCRLSVLVGIRNDPGKTIDSVTVQFQLPSCILSADLTSNYGIVNILSDKVHIGNNLSFVIYCRNQEVKIVRYNFFVLLL